jgi:hypothetical protein
LEETIMAYNYFPAGYQPYYPTQNNAYPTQMNVGPTQPTQNNGIIWVQGEAGAKSYMVAPNTTVQLWDSESQTIYLKSADASGMPSMRIIDYTIRDSTPKTPNLSQQSDYATKSELQAVLNELNALKAKFEAPGKVVNNEPTV